MINRTVESAQSVIDGEPTASAPVLYASGHELSFSLQPEDLRNQDLVSVVVEAVCAEFGLDQQRPRLYLVFSELMSNAIDHGILQLDSSIKDSAGGFDLYLELRADRLSALESGCVNIAVSELTSRNGTPFLKVIVADSGSGFDFTGRSSLNDLADMSATHGRGLAILAHLCASIQHQPPGNQVEVVFNLSV